jgi:hypothetical protein
MVAVKSSGPGDKPVNCHGFWELPAAYRLPPAFSRVIMLAMRRAGRWLLNLVAGVSAVLLVSYLFLWARTWTRQDHIWLTAWHHLIDIRPEPRRLYVLIAPDAQGTEPLSFRSIGVGSGDPENKGGPDFTLVYDGPEREVRLMGSSFASHPDATFLFGNRRVATHTTVCEAILAWPAPATLFAILPASWTALWFCRGRQHRNRIRDGCCPVCGYDLRATPERCPECGAAVERAAGKGAAT